MNSNKLISFKNLELYDTNIKEYILKLNKWDTKQDLLINGETIKTINGVSILGDGDIEISATEGVLAYDNIPTENSQNLVKSGGIYNFVKTESDNLNTTLRNYIDGKHQTKILYQSDNPNFGDITLNDDLSNYSFIEIFCETSDGVDLYQKVFNPNIKKVNFSYSFINQSELFVSQFKNYVLQNNQIISELNTSGIVTTTGNNKHNIDSSNDYIGITLVIGYTNNNITQI